MVFREMVYQKERNFYPLLLAEGRRFGYHYVAVSFGAYPCAYIQIDDEKHPYYKKHYDIINENEPPVDFTYSERYLNIPDEQDPPDITHNNSGWWIGWDYAHKNNENADIDKITKDIYDVIYFLASAKGFDSSFERWYPKGTYQEDKEKGILDKIED